MRLHWIHLWRSKFWQRAGEEERRLIEIRYCLARTVRRRRRQAGITQRELADHLNLVQSTISRMERASNRVSLDVGVRGLIALGCTEAEIAAVFNVSDHRGVQLLRKRAAQGFVRRDVDKTPGTEHRFLRKGQVPDSWRTGDPP